MSTMSSVLCAGMPKLGMPQTGMPTTGMPQTGMPTNGMPKFIISIAFDCIFGITIDMTTTLIITLKSKIILFQFNHIVEYLIYFTFKKLHNHDVTIENDQIKILIIFEIENMIILMRLYSNLIKMDQLTILFDFNYKTRSINDKMILDLTLKIKNILLSHQQVIIILHNSKVGIPINQC